MSIEEFQDRVIPLKNRFFGLAYSMTSNSAEAEDLVQEAFIKLWNMRDRLRHIENLEGWCMRVLRNLAIDQMRKKTPPTDPIEERWDLQAKTADPHQLTETQDEMQRIENLMLQLPDKQRTVIKLRDVQGYSYKEISETLDLPMSQVKVYLHRARQQMRKLLTQKLEQENA